MARAMSRAAELGLEAVIIEGGLIAPELVQKIAAADRSSKLAAGYDCPKGTSLGDEIARYFRIGQALWSDYDRIETPTVTQTASFARDLLAHCFGFDDLTGPVDHVDGNRRFRLAWEGKGGRVPVVVAAPVPGREAFNLSAPEFGDGAGGGRARRSPVSLLQDWLNGADQALWGLVFAGDRVRLMRDNASLTRPAWIEADLGAIFREEMFADFTAWWLLVHATRFGAAEAPPSDCPLEDWRSEGLKQGVEARADLYKNVKEALIELGQGVVEANPAICDRLKDHTALTHFFEELLRTAYRLIFLAVAEDRDLLHPRRATQDARALYAGSYGFGFWRERSRRRVARDTHQDAWEAMKITLGCLERGEELLGLPALGGLFAGGATPLMNEARISNRRFLSAMFHLGFIRRDGATHRINWRDLKTEELGSVYEGLLEIRPVLTVAGDFELDEGAKGNARKTSGSYYTPDSLVETLLDSALNPVLQKAEDDAEDAEAKVAAILDLKVIDPACGSGHFLLGAARRMADRVAKLRNEDAGKDETQAALRDVVSRCIHGVDRNPMAVELAKVALWIESVSPGMPLGFLDGNIRCGDALLGVFDLATLEAGIPDEAYKPLTGDDKDAANGLRKLNRAERDTPLLKAIFDPGRLSGAFRRFHRMPETTSREVAARAAEYAAIRASADWVALRQACDAYVAAFLLPKPKPAGLRDRPMVPTTGDIRNILSGGSMLGTGDVQGRLTAEIEGAAYGASVLHWPLEFPDILIGRGGFDVVLGNPPWEVMQLSDKEYFASLNPDISTLTGAKRKEAIEALSTTNPSIYLEYQLVKRRSSSVNEFIRSSKQFGLVSKGKINTFGIFAAQSLAIASDKGGFGLILPSEIMTSETLSPFLDHLIKSRRLRSSISFENEEFVFPDIANVVRFCLLTVGHNYKVDENITIANFLRQVDQVCDGRRLVRVVPEDFPIFTPTLGTSPIFRSNTDYQLSKRIFERLPAFGEKLNVGWKVDAKQGLFNMTSSSHLFKEKGYLESRGFRLAPNKMFSVGDDQYISLYEGKFLSHFDHRFSSYHNLGKEKGRGGRGLPPVKLEEYNNENFEILPRYWTEVQEVEAALAPFKWERRWLIAWRDISNAKVERTSTFAIIPWSGVGDTASLLFSYHDPKLTACLVANFNSLVFDFCARQIVGGTHMTVGYLEQLPVILPSVYSEADLNFIVLRVLELTYTSNSLTPFARDLGYKGKSFNWDEDRRAQLRAELDAWYALAYGLTRDELRYVLDPADVMGADYPSETFRVLKTNEERKYGEYRTRRLVLAAYDDLTAQGLRPRLEGYR